MKRLTRDIQIGLLATAFGWLFQPSVGAQEQAVLGSGGGMSGEGQYYTIASIGQPTSGVARTGTRVSGVGFWESVAEQFVLPKVEVIQVARLSFNPGVSEPMAVSAGDTLVVSVEGREVTGIAAGDLRIRLYAK
jgi:hypothetical protein